MAAMTPPDELGDSFYYPPQARVRLAELGGGPALAFDFNPVKVGLKQSAQTAGMPNVMSTTAEQSIVSSGKLAMNLDGVRFVGPNTRANVEQLLVWSTGQPTTAVVGAAKSLASNAASSLASSVSQALRESASTTFTPKPAKSASAAGKGSMESSKLPPLTFTWGTAWNYTVVIAHLDVTYDRFSIDGKPLAASVGLTLQSTEPPVEEPVYPFTNPTSGGLPGRSAHRVTAGDSLVMIANDTYGDSGSWRALAEVNGIDDPLRLAPGKQLYLPNAGELTAGGTPWT
jgi:hypothetical protein